MPFASGSISVSGNGSLLCRLVIFLTMRFHDTLDDVLKNASYVRVLRVLFGFPPAAVSAREVARRAGLSHPTASAVLDGLLDTGIVTLTGSAQSTRYRLNPASVLTERLEPLFSWEGTVQDELITFVRSHLERMPGVTDAFIFGSVANATETARSDLDLAVLCDAAHEQRIEEDIFDLVASVRRRFGTHVNPIVRVGPLERLCHGRFAGHRLWRRIRDEGVRVFEHEANVRHA